MIKIRQTFHNGEDASDGSTWMLWIDGIYIGGYTTERGAKAAARRHIASVAR